MRKIMKITVFLLIFTGVCLSAGVLYHASELTGRTNDLNLFQNGKIINNSKDSTLIVDPQKNITTYDQNEIVTPETVLRDAGMNVSGGVEPYKYLGDGNVDTSVVGDGLETKVTVVDNSDPQQDEIVTVEYNVDIPSLKVTDQTNIPTYDQDEIVTPQQVLTDAGIEVSGGEEPYKYLGEGNVDTTVIANDLETKVTVEDSSDPQQSEIKAIKYNVKKGPLKVTDQTNIPTYDQDEIVTPQQVLTDAGIEVSGGEEPYKYLGEGNVDTTVIANDLETKVTVEDSSDPQQSEIKAIKYNVKKGPLKVTDQTNTPTYDQNEIVTAEEILTDAGVTVKGGMAPYTYEGSVDTDSIGDGLETKISVSDSTEPPEKAEIEITYNIKSTPLVVTNQTEIPTYTQNEVVTPEQLFTESGITVSGGVEPYKYLGDGNIDTTVVGNDFETQIKIEDSSLPEQYSNIVVKYNVKSTPLVIEGQTKTYTYTQDEEVTPEQFLKDSGVVVSGGMEPYEYSGNVDTTAIGNGLETEIRVDDSSDPVQTKKIVIKYNVKSKPLTIGKQNQIHTYHQDAVVSAQQLLVDSGVTVSGGLAPYTYTGDVDTVAVGNGLKTTVRINDSSNPEQSQDIEITYNVDSKPLVIGGQTKTPIYQQNEQISPHQLIIDSGITVSGGTAPYTYLTEEVIDTTIVGNGLETTVRIEDSSDPIKKEDIVIVYNVESPLFIGNQTKTPTYDQNKTVTPEQLVTDSEITVSGGVEPYVYTGDVDTDSIGDGLETTITVADNSNPVQRADIKITYDVRSVLMIGNQTTTATYDLGEIVKPEQILTDAGVIVSGGVEPYTYFGEDADTTVVGNELTTTVKIDDSSNPVQEKSIEITYNVQSPPVVVENKTKKNIDN